MLADYLEGAQHAPESLAADAMDQEVCWDSLWGSEVPDLSLAGLLSPITAPTAVGSAAAGRKAPRKQRASRAKGAPRPAKKPRSLSKGVSLCHRTGRTECHVWHQGRQVYGGGFYHPEVAALAYDLLAVRIHGDKAATNFPIKLYHAELAAGDQQVSLDQLVKHLRDQGKALTRVDAKKGADNAMEAWELELSDFIAGQPSLGYYATEAEAAQAVEQAMRERDGLQAVPPPNFPLPSYGDDASLMSPIGKARTTAAGMEAAPQQQGFTQPASQAAAFFTPFQHAANVFGSSGWEEAAFGGSGGGGAAKPEETADAAMEPPVPQLMVQRKASMTPRPSLLG